MPGHTFGVINTLIWMSSDPTKKKIESLKRSLEKLEDSLVLAKGNKRKEDSILKMRARFLADIERLKKS